jgi:hypothetical protein
MDTNSSKTFPLRQAYIFAKENNLEDQAHKIEDLENEWDRKIAFTTVRKGYLIRLLEDHGLFPTFVTKCWPNGATSNGKTRRDRLVKFSDEYDAFLAGTSAEDGAEAESVAVESLEFALEAHLRDFLAKNLTQLEPGLRLYQVEGKSGIEFPVDGGRIDILAIDASEKFVVIELKLSQGRNKALGQLLYYMGWVDRNLNNGQCRGVIIASDISNELMVAVSRAPGVTLSRYKMNFSIEQVGGGNT